MASPTPKPSATAVVGPKSAPPKFQPVPPVETTTSSAPVRSNPTAKINKNLTSIPGFPIIDLTATDNLNKNDNYSDAQILALGLILRKLGYPIKKTRESVLYVIANNPELVEAQGRARIPSDFLASLQSAYIPGLDAKKEKEYLPTRTINNVSDEQIGKIVDTASLAEIGRILPEKQRNAEIAKNRKLADQGTLTTTKKVIDPRTGKTTLETKSDTPFTAEKATLSLNESLKTSNPKQYQLNQSLGFNDEVKKILAGGI